MTNHVTANAVNPLSSTKLVKAGLASRVYSRSLRVGIIDEDIYGLPKLFAQPLEELSLDSHLKFPVNRVKFSTPVELYSHSHSHSHTHTNIHTYTHTHTHTHRQTHTHTHAGTDTHTHTQRHTHDDGSFVLRAFMQ